MAVGLKNNILRVGNNRFHLPIPYELTFIDVIDTAVTLWMKPNRVF
jgi:hypothetical protein